jgi:hypothetical protein
MLIQTQKLFMMKTTKFCLFTLICMTLLFASCDRRIRKNGSGVVTTVTRQIGEFEKLEADGSYDVFLHPSVENYVTVTTDDNIVGLVQTFVQDGELHIEMSRDFINYDYTRMELHIYGNGYAYINLDGAINLTSQDTIFQSFTEIDLEGSGNIRVTAVGQDFKAAINGSGRIEANGSATNLNYKINGSGKIEGLDMISQNANAAIQGSGDIYVHAQATLNAEIDGSGNIKYLGSPVISSHISGSGSVSGY